MGLTNCVFQACGIFMIMKVCVEYETGSLLAQIKNRVIWELCLSKSNSLITVKSLPGDTRLGSHQAPPPILPGVPRCWLSWSFIDHPLVLMLGNTSQAVEMLINSQEGGRGIPTGICWNIHLITSNKDIGRGKKKKRGKNKGAGFVFREGIYSFSVLNTTDF